MKTLCILLLVSSFAHSQTVLSDLNGKSFTIKVTEHNADGRVEKMPVDKIQFKDGKIFTNFSRKNLFADAKYIASLDSASNTITIIAESTDKQKETLKWTLTITGNEISGKAERFRKGKASGYYSVK